MGSSVVVGLVATLAAADPAGVDEADVPALVAMSLQLRGWLDAFDASLASRPGVDLSGGGRRSAREVEQVHARASVCAAMPDVHAALAAGVVSVGHVDAIARAADRLEPAERDDLAALAPQLVEAARRQSVETFGRETRRLAALLSADGGLGHHERLRQQRSLRRWVDRQGLCHTHITLDPEADARLSNALDAAVASERVKHETRTFEQLKADAFMTLVTAPRATGRRPAEVTVLVDEASLRAGLHARSVCETSDGLPLPVEAVRRLCCDADIIPIVLDGQGVAVDQGRKQRVATAAQRRQLRAMYRGCGFPDCEVRFADCEIHHVIEWIKQRGPTDLDNLLPLCSRHHHTVHDGGWTLNLHADRTIELRRPDGTLHTNGSTLDVAPAGVADSDPLLVALAAADAAITRRTVAA
jgi:hypothetical protein